MLLELKRFTVIVCIFWEIYKELEKWRRVFFPGENETRIKLNGRCII